MYIPSKIYIPDGVDLSIWKPNTDHNILWITGNGGLGKTTLANQLKSWYNATVIHTDHFYNHLLFDEEIYYMKCLNQTNSRSFKIIKEYTDSRNIPYGIGVLNNSSEEYCKYTYMNLHEDFFKYLKNKLNNEFKNELFIVEGVSVTARTYDWRLIIGDDAYITLLPS